MSPFTWARLALGPPRRSRDGQGEREGSTTDGSAAQRRKLSVVSTRRMVHIVALLGATGIALAWSYRLWMLSPRRPISYAGDELFVFGHIETVDSSGWWTTNSQWGWPFGLEHLDFPLGGDHLHILTIRMLGLFTDDAVLLTNTFFFGTFFVIVLSCFLVLRELRISPAVAGMVSILFTFLPFHFSHGTAHIYRSPYYLVPVSGLILLWLAGHDGGFFVDRVLNRRRLFLAIGISALLSMADTVAMIFPMSIAGVLGAVVFIAARDWRTLLLAVGLAMVMAVSLLANNLPTLLYEADNGENAITLQRHVSEQEQYGLKVASLLLPQPDHPVQALADIGEKPYDESLFRSEGGQSLGVGGTIGLLAAVSTLFGTAFGSRRFRSERGRRRDDEGLLQRCGGLALVAVLLGVPTGLSFVMGLAGLEEFRTWNRIVIYIGFFSLVALGVILDRLRRQAEGAGIARPLVLTALAVLAAIGVWDQTPNTRPDYDRAADLFNSDSEFFRDVESEYPDGGQLFAFPVVPYPEPETSEAPGWYRHVIPFLHTTRLDTSYGGMKGREWEWQRELARLPPDLMVAALTSAGFDGIYIDRLNYRDEGAAAELALADVTGSGPSIEAESGAFSFWELRNLDTKLGGADRRALGVEVTRPIVAMLGDGFHAKARSNVLSPFAEDTAQFDIRNMTDEPHEIVVHLEIRSVPGLVEVSGPGDWEIISSDGLTIARTAIIVPPGDTPFEIHTDGPSYQAEGDPREIHMNVTIRLTGPVTDSLLVLHADELAFPAFSQ